MPAHAVLATSDPRDQKQGSLAASQSVNLKDENTADRHVDKQPQVKQPFHPSLTWPQLTRRVTMEKKPGISCNMRSSSVATNDNAWPTAKRPEALHFQRLPMD